MTRRRGSNMTTPLGLALRQGNQRLIHINHRKNKKTRMAKELPTPKKIVTYPVGEDENCGAVFFYGDPAAPNLVILCAGYPDDHEHFLPFADRLASSQKCFVGVTCLPGYDDRKDHAYTSSKPDGYSFNEWVAAMREAVKVLKAESTAKKSKLTGIFHDWGVLPGLMYTNRSIMENEDKKDGNDMMTSCTPDQIVLFDVLMGPHPKTENKPVVRNDTFYETFVTLAYRIVLASGFALRRYVSKYLGQICFISGFTTLSLLGLGPCYDIDTTKLPPRKDPISLDRLVYMAYPYYNIFKVMFTGKIRDELLGACMPLDLIKTPVLYMYGTYKRVNFHDRASIKLLEQEEKEKRRSKVVPVDNAGHFLYLQEEDICYAEVMKFIEDA